ncbi:MAG: hypothetical protein LC126_13195 [Bryobacterales bacterium]|nr:hypothetical protein [Bryobacterales bacterium]
MSPGIGKMPAPHLQDAVRAAPASRRAAPMLYTIVFSKYTSLSVRIASAAIGA